MINVCIPTLNRYDLLTNVIDTAERGSLVPDHYYIIDNGLKFDPNVFNKKTLKKISVLTPKDNLGVARSWNTFMHDVEERILICNDDIGFFEDTIEKLNNAYTDETIVFPGGFPSANAFSCFMIPKKLYNTVGPFDVEFFPAYYEDNSYHWRMTQLGYKLTGVDDTRITHFESATLKAYDHDQTEMHHLLFRHNTELYRLMWGGLPGNEKYTEKFNGSEAKRDQAYAHLKMRFNY